MHGQPCTGLAGDDAINPAAQLRFSWQLTGKAVGLRRHGYPYLSNREVCTNLNEGVRLMRIGSSLVLIAVGAILKFAVTASISGVNLPVVGVVLMVVGIAGVVLSLIMASTARRTEVVHQTARVDHVEPQQVDDPRI